MTSVLLYACLLTCKPHNVKSKWVEPREEAGHNNVGVCDLREVSLSSCRVKGEELLALPGPSCWLKPLWLLSSFPLPGDMQYLLGTLGGGATPLRVWKLVLC